MQARKRTAVVSAVRPVRPPASTPEADSMKVVTVEVPVAAPAMVPMASESRASFILGILPSLSTMPAREAVPTRVPMVSNISIMQKVMIRVMAVNQPMFTKPAKVKLEEGGGDHVGEGGHEACGLKACKGIHAEECEAADPIKDGGKEHTKQHGGL